MKRSIKNYTDKLKTLVSETEVQIRFSEVDSMAVVWHGNYVKFLEDAREDFGTKYGLHYLDVYKNGFMTPLVGLNIEYKNALQYGDQAIVKITYIDQAAAKIFFEYEIINKQTGVVAATAHTTQVFIDAQSRELQLYQPDFFSKWRQQHGF